MNKEIRLTFCIENRSMYVRATQQKSDRSTPEKWILDLFKITFKIFQLQLSPLVSWTIFKKCQFFLVLLILESVYSPTYKARSTTYAICSRTSIHDLFLRIFYKKKERFLTFLFGIVCNNTAKLSYFNL